MYRIKQKSISFKTNFEKESWSWFNFFAFEILLLNPINPSSVIFGQLKLLSLRIFPELFTQKSQLKASPTMAVSPSLLQNWSHQCFQFFYTYQKKIKFCFSPRNFYWNASKFTLCKDWMADNCFPKPKIALSVKLFSLNNIVQVDDFQKRWPW